MISIVNLIGFFHVLFILLLIYHLVQYLRKKKSKKYRSHDLINHKIKLEAYYVVLMILVSLYVILVFTGVI